MNAETGSAEWSAAIFPGQGVQFVGMGRELYAQLPRAQDFFRAAEERTELPLRQLCFEGPPEALNDTAVAQPAIFVVSYLLWALLRDAPGSPLAADGCLCYAAGHSLGEYAAAVAAGSLDPVDAVGLVAARGRFMREAGAERPGGMAAVIGMARQDLAAICDDARGDGVLLVANDNSPKQQVISGEVAPLERACQAAAAAGGRVIRLDVTIASHSALMEGASRRMDRLLHDVLDPDVNVHAPRLAMIGNMEAEPLEDGLAVCLELARHTSAPVRWTDTVRYLKLRRVSRYYEIGPKSVLARLVRQTDPDAEVQYWGEAEVLGLYD